MFSWKQGAKIREAALARKKGKKGGTCVVIYAVNLGLERN